MPNLLFLLVVGTVTNLPAGPISGGWVGRMESGSNSSPVFLRLYLGEEVAGVVAIGNETEQKQIYNPQFHGNQLTFEVRGEKSIAEFLLRLVDRKMTGTVSFRGRIANVTFFGPMYTVPNGISRPILLNSVDPEYTEAAQQANLQGTVVLLVQIDPTGRPSRVDLLQSLGFGLDEKAIEALKLWRFRPGIKDGKPIMVETTVRSTFGSADANCSGRSRLLPERALP